VIPDNFFGEFFNPTGIPQFSTIIKFFPDLIYFPVYIYNYIGNEPTLLYTSWRLTLKNHGERTGNIKCSMRSMLICLHAPKSRQIG